MLGQLLYIIGSDDSAEEVPEEKKFKYIYDLAVLDPVNVKNKTTPYDVFEHVPSDIAVDEIFLPAEQFISQEINNQISTWTSDNLMKINEDKSFYMVLSRSQESFATRLTINKNLVKKAHEIVY